MASTKLGEVDRGRDVAQERADVRRKLAAGTFRDAVERYAGTAGRGNRSWPETRRLLEREAVSVLGNKPMVSVTEATRPAWLTPWLPARRPWRAPFSPPSGLSTSGAGTRLDEINPIADLKRPAPLASRKRVLSLEELKTFWTATAALDWPFGPVYRLLLHRPAP